MIKVNFKDTTWEEGLTVKGLLQRLTKDQTHALILRGRVTVIVNNEVVSPADYGNKELQDEDNIRIYPSVGGG